jgi:hypothetical protein
MKSILALVCLSIPIMIGCSQSQTSVLQEQCSAGSKEACEELARMQRQSYAEQPGAELQKTQPMVPSPATAAPAGRHAP